MIARFGMSICILILASAMAPCADPLPLPAGCSWLTAPPQDCPVGNARAYQKWVEGNGPVTVLHDKSGIELLWVPGGRFRMGSNHGAADERPAHRVRLDGFWIGKTEVTLGQWRRASDSRRTPYSYQGDTHPALDVSWNECAEFCSRTGFQLPTEAQWEYAARGPDARVYPWGEEWDGSLCQYDADAHGFAGTLPVGSFPGGASWCGALDMAGNVWEWCRDWYDEDFYRSPAAGLRNPECTDAASGWRVLRGGSWGFPARYCRMADRSKSYPEYRFSFKGFRVALAR